MPLVLLAHGATEVTEDSEEDAQKDKEEGPGGQIDSLHVFVGEKGTCSEKSSNQSLICLAYWRCKESESESESS